MSPSLVTPGRRARRRGRSSSTGRQPRKPAATRQLGTFTATAYGPPWGGINGPGESTACGVGIHGGSPSARGVAAGIGLPCGTLLHIAPDPFSEAGGTWVVWDRGGAIGARSIDFYLPDRAAQLSWGRRNVRVSQVGKITLPHEAGEIDAAIGKSGQNVVDPAALNPTNTLDAVTGAAGDVADATAGAIGRIADVLEKIAQFFVGLGELLLTPEGWLRVGKLGFGVAFVFMGLNRIIALTTGKSPAAGVKSGAIRALGATQLARGNIVGGAAIEATA